MRTQALRIVTWYFLSTRAHNYVKIAVSKGIYTRLTESVQNPRCTGKHLPALDMQFHMDYIMGLRTFFRQLHPASYFLSQMAASDLT